MPDVVTFDPVNLRIVEISTGGNNELDVVEIYSEWKEWMKLSDNLKHPPAFRFVGGDPISDIQDLGSTFFLTNGWRIRPAELSHRLTLVGNIFSDPSGPSIFVPTLGTFTVNAETRVSNLTDSSVSRLDLVQLLQSIFIDSVNGDDANTGVPTEPVKTVPRARVLADTDNIRSYSIRGEITVDQDHLDWTFLGLSSVQNDIINLAGFDITNSKVESMTIKGTASGTGSINARDCVLNTVSNISGQFNECTFLGVVVLKASQSFLIQCTGGGFGGATLDIGGAGNVVAGSQLAGEFKIVNALSGVPFPSVVALNCGSADVVFDNTNTSTSMEMRGIAELDDQTVGEIVDTTGLIDPNNVRLVKQMLAGKAVVSVDDLTVTIFDEDDTTVLATFDISADGRNRTPA